MDIGLGIVEVLVDLVFQVAVAIAEAVAALADMVVGIMVDLLLVLIEAGLYVVLWIASPFLSAENRSHKLSEKFRIVCRRVVYATLALVAVYALVYFVWLREPPPPPSPTPLPATKIEKARRVIEQAKQIKERLLPKSQP